MGLLLIIYEATRLTDSNFREFSGKNRGEKACAFAGVTIGRRALFEADEAAHESHAIELALGKLERLVVGVVGNDKDVLIVGTAPDALDERSLLRVEHVGLIPLKEQIIERNTLASHEVPGIVSGLHGIALDLDEEIGTFECRNDITLTFVLHNRRFSGERTRHCTERYERYAFKTIFRNGMRHFSMSLNVIAIIYKHRAFSS